MNKAAEYRNFARECRSLAQAMNTRDGWEQLLKIAAAWEALAADHEGRFDRPPELSALQRAAARFLLARPRPG